jgi:hypothetical protein
MGKRGPKAVDIGLLLGWEREYMMAFSHLRDGRYFVEPPSHETLDTAKADARIKTLKRLPPEGITDVRRPPAISETTYDDYVKRKRSEEIMKIQQMRPEEIAEQSQRREIWNDLVRAMTKKGIRRVCRRWVKLPDLNPARAFAPHYIQEYASEFLKIKRSPQFPRANYTDDSRLRYLARGMAGVMARVSPMTGIERLRNMKHARGGPLWNRVTRQCECWHCQIEREKGKTT